MVASPIVPTIVEEGEVQETRPIVFVVPKELAIVKVVEEKEPIMVDPSIIEAIVEVLPVVAKA